MSLDVHDEPTVDSPGEGPTAPDRRRRYLAIIWIAVGVLLAALLASVLTVVLSSHTSPGDAAPAIPASFGSGFDKVVPSSIANIPLLDEHGRTTDLAALHGKIVVLVDFLTSCQDECPISTGALTQVQRWLVDAHVTRDIDIVDVSVDPTRDDPARLLNYSHYTGVSFTLLTGTQGHLDSLWKFFGVSYDKVAEDSPPGIDWESGKPYTYDVDHANDVFVLDRAGNVRLLTQGLPNVHKTLPSALRRLLSPLGVQHLDHPGFASWTAKDLLDAISYEYGKKIPTS